MSWHSQGTVDPLNIGEILERQHAGGVLLTFTVPTDVTGQSADRASLILKNLVRDARNELLERGLREADATTLLAPVSEIVDDSSYWRLQSRGLVIFAAEGFTQAVRVPIELRESLTVGERFNLLPLAPVLASDQHVYVLAVTKNEVRLFDSSRNTIEQLPLENVPGSFDEVIDELPEKTVDVRVGSAGVGGTPSVHGTGGDIDRMLLEKYLHAIGQAIGTRLGTARSQPLVLAAVAEYLPIFKAACPYPAVFDGVIPGNPEGVQPDELRSAAWRLVTDQETQREADEEERAHTLIRAGRGSRDLSEIAQAAEEGRIDTLYLPRDDRQIDDADARTLANDAIVGTLTTSGTLRTLGSTDGCLAVFRY